VFFHLAKRRVESHLGSVLALVMGVSLLVGWPRASRQSQTPRLSDQKIISELGVEGGRGMEMEMEMMENECTRENQRVK
jgi:hypothetical protein